MPRPPPRQQSPLQSCFEGADGFFKTIFVLLTFFFFFKTIFVLYSSVFCWLVKEFKCLCEPSSRGVLGRLKKNSSKTR